MKKYLFIVFSILLIGCSVSIRMKMNGEKKYKIDISEGKIVMTCRAENFIRFKAELKFIQGEFDFYPDKFEMLTLMPELSISNIRWFLNNKQIKDYTQLNKGDILVCQFDFSNENVQSKNGNIKFIIPPNSSLQYHSINVIQNRVEIGF